MDLRADAGAERGMENHVGVISRLSGKRRRMERAGFVFRRKYAGRGKLSECFLRLLNRAYRMGKFL